MKIGIIDADLIGKQKQRFPNLACMKISSYYKSRGHSVNLLTSYDDIENYEKVFISKVFTDTEVPEGVLNLPWVEHGGTGFYYDKAPPLDYDIEHSMPDYHLYDDFINKQIEYATACEDDEEKKEKIIRRKRNEFKYYIDYSIGFTTRGCIRGCSFCVNKNYRKCLKHSPVSEFLDPKRKYICLLDDNVLSCRDWKHIFEELNATGKRFQFKQGMDERLLTDEKCEVIFNSNWIGDYIFAFDDIRDRRLVEKKLKLIRKHTDMIPKFYCFCAYNHEKPNTYSHNFWVNDIHCLFERIKILLQYKAVPYVMRFKDYKKSPYYGMYVTIARWCNQKNCISKMTFREFCERTAEHGEKAPMKYMTEFEEKFPFITVQYYDIRFGEKQPETIPFLYEEQQ